MSLQCLFFFFNDPATTEVYTYRHTLSLHDALPISRSLTCANASGSAWTAPMSVIWRSRWERGGPDRTKCCSVRRWNCVSRLVKSPHRNVKSIKAPMPIAPTAPRCVANARRIAGKQCRACKGVSSLRQAPSRSEEHTSELQSLMRISSAVFCLKKKKQQSNKHTKQEEREILTQHSTTNQIKHAYM